MVEMGSCIGRCKNPQKCFFVKDYFMCGHLMCYSLAIKFLCCIHCGHSTFRYCMTDNREDVVVNRSILPKTCDCYCVKCKVLSRLTRW